MQKESPTLNSRFWVTMINANDYCDLLGQLIQAIKPYSRLWGTTINANDYCDMLGQITDAIHRNRHGCPLQIMIPLHNNTSTQPTSYESSYSHFWKFLDHPPCSLPLPHQSIILNIVHAPCNNVTYTK